jgi:hypothetical protein
MSKQLRRVARNGHAFQVRVRPDGFDLDKASLSPRRDRRRVSSGVHLQARRSFTLALGRERARALRSAA